ncbi:MAG: hydantoinase B/oxoprolinase family protein [Rhodospirillales bacterium]|nr:hydantoinase B/oxoprolinase family protein [Rhodospirillales bacterium]
MKLDPVEYAIVSQSLIAAAREMGAKLVRSAYSTIMREAKDGSAALLDAKGETVAQAELIPMQLGTIGLIFKACGRMFPNETLEEGDILVINDPYSGGQHLQDIFFFQPIFFESKVIGFGASVCHHLDIGGGSPGLNSAARDLYAEGLILPPMKINIHRDWNGGGFHRLLRANVRVPEQTMGDFDAQIAANNIGILRVQELAQRYGVDKVIATMDGIQDYSERRMRAAIAEVPDGVYHGEAQIDDDGLGGGPVVIRTALTVKGDAISVDYAGTDPQVRTNLNMPFASVVSATVSCIKAVLTSPDIPFNDGMLRPVSVEAPLGTILNPRHPAPVRARMIAAYRCWNAVMQALAQAVPKKVIAQGYDSTTSFCLSWLSPKGWSVYLEVYGGGYGAGVNNDGCDAVDCPLSSCANTPVEAMDQEYSFFEVTAYGFEPDSCGKGEYRGGVGLSRSFEIVKEGVVLAFYSDRFKGKPAGIFGGESASNGSCTIRRGKETIHLTANDSMHLNIGDIVKISLGGGGGYGLPSKRDAASIQRDLEDGIITDQYAQNWISREVA